MAKGDLFQRALPYYVLAAVAFFKKYDPQTQGGNATLPRIQSYWADEIDDDAREFILNEELLKAALEVCHEARIIEALLDEFGPPIYVKLGGADIFTYYENLETSPQYKDLFNKLDRSGDLWLRAALKNIRDKIRQEGGIKREAVDEWAPIPIERELRVFGEADTKLNEAIEAVRSDNGYTANHPEER